jgi:hypothetical protein
MIEQDGQISSAEIELERRRAELGQEALKLLAALAGGNAPYATSRLDIGCGQFGLTVSLLEDPGTSRVNLISDDLVELLKDVDETKVRSVGE